MITSIKGATLTSIIGWVIVQLFPETIILIFNDNNAELLKICKSGIRISLAALPLIGFQIIVGNYYQSMGQAKTAALLSLLQQVLLLIPAILIFPNI